MSFNKAKALKTASKYVQQGKYPAAIEEYRKIIQAEPSDITTLNTLGDLCVKVGDTEEAIRSFVRIAEHYRTGGFNLKAIAMFKKVSKLDPANIEIGLKLAGLYAQQKLMVDARHQYLAVAEHYLHAGQNKEALGIYQKIADLDPENTAIQLKLAEAYLREQQLDQAYEAFIAAANELQRQNKTEEALQTYLKALKTNPEGQLALSAAVNLYTLRGEPQRAAALIKHLLGARPDDADLLVILGRVHQAAEEMDEAESAMARAFEINSGNYQYLLDLASFFARNGELERALRQFDHVSEMLHERREEEKAVALLHEVIARDANHFGALERLAAIYSRIREDHNLIETLNSLADAAVRKGEDEVAINTLRQLMQLEPDEIKHRRRLRSLGLSDEDMQRLNSPMMMAQAEIQPSVPPASTQHLREFEVAQPQPAVSWGDIPGNEFEIQIEAPTAQVADLALGGESQDAFEVSIAGNESSYAFAFSDDEMVDGAASEAAIMWPQPIAAEEHGFEAAASEMDLSDDLIASSSQNFLESYLAEEEEPASLETAMSGGAAESFDLLSDAEADEVRLREEIESVDFYITQSMFDVARYSLDALDEQFPAHSQVKAARERLAVAEAGTRVATNGQSPASTNREDHIGAFESSTPSEQETETIFVLPPSSSRTAEDAGPQPTVLTGEAAFDGRLTPTAPTPNVQTAPTASFFGDLLDECSDEPFGFEDKVRAQTATPVVAEPTEQREPEDNDELLDMLDEFKSGTDQVVNVEDFETHYNLGLAYKDMEMFDDAVGEFQQAFKAISAETSSQNYLLCCNMLGFCFTQKNLPRLAVMWFKKGLDASGRTEDEYQALRYDLASAYANLGELERAYDTFSEVYGIDVNYRGVTAKLRELEQQMASKQL